MLSAVHTLLCVCTFLCLLTSTFAFVQYGKTAIRVRHRQSVSLIRSQSFVLAAKPDLFSGAYWVCAAFMGSMAQERVEWRQWCRRETHYKVVDDLVSNFRDTGRKFASTAYNLIFSTLRTRRRFHNTNLLEYKTHKQKCLWFEFKWMKPTDLFRWMKRERALSASCLFKSSPFRG